MAKSPKKTPNPHGRLGGPAHRREVQKASEDMRTRQLNPITEFFIRLKTGKRRFIDLVGLDQNDEVKELVQVGKTTQSGIPIKREREAISDIEEHTGLKVRFISYTTLGLLIVFAIVFAITQTAIL